ncbi:MAG TPA: hypothetical protein VHY75_16680 [Steroidobacteraceae bacterium]|jgi:hypothetical protein|nr:hypothetical protein [Steroidobacteraceae bacterium]
MTRASSERSAWIVGVVGLAGAMTGWVMAPSRFPFAWLAALTCFLGWPLGSLALVLIHALTGGRWGFAIRSQLAAGIATLPLIVPAALPLLFVTRELYPWMQPEVAAHLHNRFYLNAAFFYARGGIELAVWLGLAVTVLRVLRTEDPQAALYRLAPPALILLGFTVTFSAIDLTLSLEPTFKSSVYGMLVCAEAVLLALSIAIVGVAAAPLASEKKVIHDLGRLLLALLVLWAYLDFMQILIVWNSDLPDEAGWYLHRLAGRWVYLAVAIAGLHFVLPFFLLIWPPLQRSRAAIGSIAALMVLIEIPRAWWNVIPASGHGLDWVDVAAMAGLLGLAAAVALHAFHGPRQARAVCARG